MAKAQDINQENMVIDTVEQLVAKYPDLTQKLIGSVSTKIEPITTTEELEKAYPELVKKIIDGAVVDASIQLVSQKGEGFVLGIKDPFAEGALRLYKQISGNNALSLPCIVSFKDKAAARVINNYLIRARGGCDSKRIEAAESALKKCK